MLETNHGLTFGDVVWVAQVVPASGIATRHDKGQDGEDEHVEDANDGEDESPADTAATDGVGVCVSAADASHMLVVPTGGEDEATKEHAKTWNYVKQRGYTHGNSLRHCYTL